MPELADGRSALGEGDVQVHQTGSAAVARTHRHGDWRRRRYQDAVNDRGDPDGDYYSPVRHRPIAEATLCAVQDLADFSPLLRNETDRCSPLFLTAPALDGAGLAEASGQGAAGAMARRCTAGAQGSAGEGGRKRWICRGQGALRTHFPVQGGPLLAGRPDAGRLRGEGLFERIVRRLCAHSVTQCCPSLSRSALASEGPQVPAG